MLYRKSSRYVLLASLTFIFSSSVQHAQVKEQSYLRRVPSEVGREDPRVQAIIDRAIDYFLKGEMNLRDGKREAAHRDFNESVDSILKSGMDVRSNPRLQAFLTQLVEKVYRLEVPAQTGPPPAQPAPKESAPAVGFAEQKFEPSPRDVLAKFELMKEETGGEPAPAPRAPKVKPRVAGSILLGPPPRQLADGRVPVVVRYLNENLHDPYSMRLIRWSQVRKVIRDGEPFWYVSLRMRARNAFGAYVLREAGFYLRHNRVVLTDDL